MENFYHILGIPENAGDKEIKKAFRTLAKQHHPDTAKGDSAKFRQVNHAYKILSNPESRYDYDKTLGNFRNKTSDFRNYTENTYNVQGKHLKKLLKEIINQGSLTSVKINYKGKTLFSMSFPVATVITMIGLIKAPIAFLIVNFGLNALFEVEITNQIVLMYNEAVGYHSAGRIIEAEQLYNRILQRSEYFVPAYLNLGTLYRQRGENRKAAQYFKQALDIAPYGDIGEIARKNLNELREF
ncbi:MAG: DnaJ domain-containing protein [Desulfobacteraceae bacterium]|nr:DnaJ domain-containing protein [Desulfobacteraceae bacterium]